MAWIILTTIVLILLAGCVFASGAIKRVKDHPDFGRIPPVAPWIASGVIAVVWALMTILFSVHQVGAGHVGVVYTFGSITGQRSSGLQVTAPWQSLTSANVQLQTLCFLKDHSKCPDGATPVGDGLDSFSKETQNVFIDAIVNVEVQPGDVQGLYRGVGPNYINKLIPGRIAQIFKDETVKYAAVDLAPNREIIRHNVEQALTTALATYSIKVDALLIDNISFEPAFEAAITDKQVAAQEALKQQQLVAAHKSQADQATEDARGQAESIKVVADGQAAANTALAASLTPALIQFQALQKLGPDVKIALIPSGQGIIIDPSSLLGKTTTP